MQVSTNWGASKQQDPELICRKTPAGVRQARRSLTCADFGIRCNLHKRLKPDSTEIVADYASQDRGTNIMGFDHVFPGDTLRLVYTSGDHLYEHGEHIKPGGELTVRVSECVQGMYVYRGNRIMNDTCGAFRAWVVTRKIDLFNTKRHPEFLRTETNLIAQGEDIFGTEERIDQIGSAIRDNAEPRDYSDVLLGRGSGA